MGAMSPNPLLRPGQFRIKMVFLNAQLFRRCLIIAEQLNVLVMGSDKYSIQQKAAVAAVAANQTSGVDIVPATVTEGMRKVKHLTVNLTQIATTNAESNLFWASVYVPQGDNGRGTQHRNIGSNSRQHVRTQPVCHELRRGRPFSRSHQDVLSYLSQPQRRRQDHSPHPSYSMGRLPLSLLLFAMQSPSTKSQFRWIDVWAMGNTKFPSPPIH